MPVPHLRLIAALSSIALLIVVTASPATVRAGQSPAIGYNGGTEVTLTCPDGQWLAGFDVGAVEWIHHLGPLCASTGNDAARTAAPAPIGTQTLWWDVGKPPLIPLERSERQGTLGMGSSGDGWLVRPVECPDRTQLVGLDIYFAQVNGMVGLIDLLCRPSVGLELKRVKLGDFVYPMGVPRAQFSPANRAMCPEGEVARGIYGRSGRAVDKLGLVCAPMAASADVTPSTTRRMRPGERLPDSPARRDTRWLPREPSTERRTPGAWGGATAPAPAPDAPPAAGDESPPADQRPADAPPADPAPPAQ